MEILDSPNETTDQNQNENVNTNSGSLCRKRTIAEEQSLGLKIGDGMYLISYCEKCCKREPEVCNDNDATPGDTGLCPLIPPLDPSICPKGRPQGVPEGTQQFNDVNCSKDHTCARLRPPPPSLKRNRQAPEAKAAGEAKRQFVRSTPYCVSGRRRAWKQLQHGHTGGVGMGSGSVVVGNDGHGGQ
eukprot:CAMPEP_0197857242 /NCGR_PEP_ID=MMETSP1438-20131217/30108_1 /TAXON_ID=1461541 /ORGANISM="Pterosperma sp., Strain CCMP1384" /LENGTH=185 /DNA_ID=CAMNT_0043472997 /DNA_START=81 /DNA_END=635 /DNA_ORIENTATION=-